jgi:hypothetical protein
LYSDNRRAENFKPLLATAANNWSEFAVARYSILAPLRAGGRTGKPWVSKRLERGDSVADERRVTGRTCSVFHTMSA